jgi:hypothetical protein
MVAATGKPPGHSPKLMVAAARWCTTDRLRVLMVNRIAEQRNAAKLSTAARLD